MMLSMSDTEEQLKQVREYVTTMVASGYDALELDVIQKKFKNYDVPFLLTRLGCDVIEDLVLLRLNEDDYLDDEHYF